MAQVKAGKHFLPIVILFVIVSVLLLAAKSYLETHGVNAYVILAGNVLLFLLSTLSLFMQMKALSNKNPNVFIRSVLGGTVMKLFVLGAAALIYVVLSGKDRNVYGIVGVMILYILYAVFEVRSALKLNQPKNAGN